MQTLCIPLSQDPYNIYLGSLPKITHPGKILIVSNPKILGLHSKVLENFSGKEVYIASISDGENYKTFTSIENILEQAFNHKLDRKSLFIALGGGVIGDMVGFAAGIFMRGVPFVQIPTTLLSQVDASVGGKTGVNNAFGKNLIGLFHQPKAVYIDTQFLKTLPLREFKAGIAEIIKMAVCFSKELFECLEGLTLKKLLCDELILQDVIHKAIQIKTEVVLCDSKEQGLRAALNYGHTFGHVIEHESGYGTLLHGEAVAIGMKMANTLAVKLDVLKQNDNDRINNLLEQYELSYPYHIKDTNSFYEKFFLDKKSENAAIKFVLPTTIGGFEFYNNIPKNKVMEVLEQFV